MVAVNHLGDWGTQFGKMIVAYKLWGNDDEIKQNPIAELQKLYVKFHDAEKEDSIEDQAREVFKSLKRKMKNIFVYGRGLKRNHLENLWICMTS